MWILRVIQKSSTRSQCHLDNVPTLSDESAGSISAPRDSMVVDGTKEARPSGLGRPGMPRIGDLLHGHGPGEVLGREAFGSVKIYATMSTSGTERGAQREPIRKQVQSLPTSPGALFSGHGRRIRFERICGGR